MRGVVLSRDGNVLHAAFQQSHDFSGSGRVNLLHEETRSRDHGFALVRALREEHGYYHEIKWRNVKRQALPFYDDLIEAFFKTTWLRFHCCVIERA